MIRGFINPKKILGDTNITPEAFQKFMLGDTPGLTSFASKAAANNIVKFNSTGVKASSGVSSELLNDISTNIVTNVNNSLSNIVGGLQNNIAQYVSKVNSNVNNSITLLQKQFSNIQTQLQEGFSTTVKQFEDDYRNKITAIEDRTPSRILNSFLKLYENAIGFVNFFGDQKNISKITQKLKRLRGIFTESFEVAKIIRQVINKIVKQLTNLPTASTSSSGGLNVDIDVPGGALKRSSGSRLGNIMKTGGKVALGALGVVGAAAGVSAIASTLTPAKEYQQKKLEESKAMRAEPPSIFDEIASVFTKAVDKFTNIIQQLTDESNTPPRSSGSSGSPPPPPPPPAPSPRSSMDNAGGVSPNIPSDDKELLKRLMVAEAYGEGVEGMAAVGRSVLNRVGLIQSGKVSPGTFNATGGSIKEVIKAPLQYSPHAGGKLNRPLTPEENSKAESAYQLIFNTAEYRKALKSKFGLSEEHLNRAEVATGFRNRSIARYDSSQDVNEFEVGRHTFNTAGNAGNIAGFQLMSTYGNLLDSISPQKPSKTPTTSSSTPTLSNLFPANTQFKLTGDSTGQAESSTGNMNIENILNLVRAEETVSYKKAVPKPPKILSIPETNMIDATTSSQPTGKAPQAQSIDSSSPTVPFMSASNPDNFYVHLAALTFNLVNR